jgi:hypothetical protein
MTMIVVIVIMIITIVWAIITTGMIIPFLIHVHQEDGIDNMMGIMYCF